MVNKMVKDSFIAKILAIMDNLKMGYKMDQDLFVLTAIAFMEILKMVINMDRGKLFIKMEINMKEYGKIISINLLLINFFLKL